ncbi:hypothetical protein RHMOL_Rhmol03G0029100 [Rhododendron molle]|uniref:Uncharacterized protein n=2 Tax=Rhododendron molle TaxID=49168 RepID=A0ACC0PC97_RHOML|nr:hypothetical protein RHMOL_Rhmol03G0029100 [Rhododendron molle]KAI8562343.1 hypothetical protein RHMOL_Rhmol03G0029100 [Rhododendron molle]
MVPWSEERGREPIEPGDGVCDGLSGGKYPITWVGTQSRLVYSAVEVSEFVCDELHSEVRAEEKDTALRQALSRLASDFGRESMLSLQRFFNSRRLPVISTGSLKLDIALGIGGLPKGRMVEIYGQEASGKTTLAFHIIKEAQKLGGYCAYLDVENAMDPSLAEAIGVNTENLLISQPDSAENLLCMVDTLTKSGSVDVAALVPQREIDVVLIGDKYKDMQSQIMTQALRKIRSSLCQSQTLIIFVNQVRSNVKSAKGFGHAEEVTCGGNALPFHAAVTGVGICVQVVKNTLSPPMKKAELAIKFGRGIRCESEVLDLACEHGVIVEEGDNFFIDGDVVKNRNEAERYLAENDAVLDNIVKCLRCRLFEGQA